MRAIIILTSLLLTFQTFGQLLTENFVGQIKYNIQNYSGFITRDSCGDFTDKRALIKKNDYFQINDTSLLEQETKQYFLTKFIRNKKYLKLIYYNPTNKSNDTIDQFPLNKGDTIESSDDYLVYADSIKSWNSSDKKWYFKEVRISTMNISETTNIGDTIITVLGQPYNCYRFEKFKYWRKSNPGPSHTRRIIYIDKTSCNPPYFRSAYLTTN
jgi:hypothetical protein